MDKSIIKKVQQAMEADEDMQKEFAAYDDMDAVKFDFGEILEPWMIPSVMTDGSEALKVLANIFDTHSPRINILPFNEADKERAERLERWAEFHVQRINNRSGKSPFRKIAHMSGKYNRVLAQVETEHQAVARAHVRPHPAQESIGLSISEVTQIAAQEQRHLAAVGL